MQSTMANHALQHLICVREIRFCFGQATSHEYCVTTVRTNCPS